MFVLGRTALGVVGVGVLAPFAALFVVLLALQVPSLGEFLNLVVVCLGTGAVAGLWSDRGR